MSRRLPEAAQLTDEQVDQLFSSAEAAKKQAAPTPLPAADSLSDEELDKLFQSAQAKPAEKKGEGFGSMVLGALGKAQDLEDRYGGGAAVRRGLSEVIGGAGPLEAAGEAVGQYGKPGAPSGADIAAELGVSHEPLAPGLPNVVKIPGNPAQAIYALARGAPQNELAGAAIGAATDPMSYLGGTVVKGAGKALEAGGKAAGAAVDALKAIPGGQGLVAGGQAAAESARTAVEAAKSVPGVLGQAAKGVVKELAPEYKPGYSDALKVAARNGIDPELMPPSVRYGENSTMSRGWRRLADIPGGEEVRSNWEKSYGQLNSAVDRELQGFTGGPPPSPQDTGALIRKSYQQAIDELLSEENFSYKTLSAEKPGAGIFPATKQELDGKLSSFRDEIADKLKREGPGADRAQMQSTLGWIDTIQKNLKGSRYSSLVDQMQTVGRNAYGKPAVQVGLPQPDRGSAKALYGMLREAALDTVDRHLGGDIRDQIEEGNAIKTQFFKDQKPILRVLQDQNVPDEQVFSRIVGSGDSQKIQALKTVLGEHQPEAISAAKATYLDSMLRRGKEGISYGSALRTLKNDSKAQRVASNLFEPGELDNLKDLIKLGSDYGPMTGNPSGTAVSQAHGNLVGSLVERLQNQPMLQAMENSARRKFMTGSVPPAGDQMGGMAMPQSLMEVAQSPEFQAGMKPGMSEGQMAALGLRTLGSLQTRSGAQPQAVAVPPTFYGPVADAISGADELDSVQKAMLIDQLNRRGEIGDVRKFAPKAPQQAPALQDALQRMQNARQPSPVGRNQ